jgi:signal transduction histidine kinase
VGEVKRLESVRARVRAVDPFRKDIVLAALFVAVGLVEISGLDGEGGDRAVTLVACGVAMSAVASRRRDPVVAAALFLGAALVQAPLDGFLTANSTVPFLAALLLLYSTGRYADGWRFPVAGGALAVGTMFALWFETGWEGAGELVWATFLFAVPLFVGRALRSRALLQAELRKKAERAERESNDAARAAVEDERARIAEELQTLVANGVSAMVVQAEAVPRALQAGGPARAAEALGAVEATGRDALHEMRRLLGVLRREGAGLELAPQPGLGRVEALAERAREGGLDVTLRVEGERRPLPPGVDLTAYRIVQDALDAAAEQQAGSAEVSIGYDERALRLTVRDDRDGGASDRIPGLIERVGLYGGNLRYGHRDDGRFALRVELPLDPAYHSSTAGVPA